MFKNLYDCFEHWYHGGSIYLYSDPHFNDEEMKEIRKNYIGDDKQVKAINKVVHKNDTIIFLGDIGDTTFIKKINGYKVLILGNHDKGATTYKRVKNSHLGAPYVTESKIKTLEPIIQELKNYVLDNQLFDEVYEGPLMISDKIILSHEPVEFKYAFNIHGHDHSNIIKKDFTIINKKTKTYDNNCGYSEYDSKGNIIRDYYPVNKQEAIKKFNTEFPDKHVLGVRSSGVGHDGYEQWTISYCDALVKSHMNVCAELIYYTPVSLKFIVESGLTKNVPNIHRETIDKAIAKHK